MNTPKNALRSIWDVLTLGRTERRSLARVNTNVTPYTAFTLTNRVKYIAFIATLLVDSRWHIKAEEWSDNSSQLCSPEPRPPSHSPTPSFSPGNHRRGIRSTGRTDSRQAAFTPRSAGYQLFWLCVYLWGKSRLAPGCRASKVWTVDSLGSGPDLVLRFVLCYIKESNVTLKVNFQRFQLHFGVCIYSVYISLWDHFVMDMCWVVGKQTSSAFCWHQRRGSPAQMKTLTCWPIRQVPTWHPSSSICWFKEMWLTFLKVRGVNGEVTQKRTYKSFQQIWINGGIQEFVFLFFYTLILCSTYYYTTSTTPTPNISTLTATTITPSSNNTTTSKTSSWQHFLKENVSFFSLLCSFWHIFCSSTPRRRGAGRWSRVFKLHDGL